MGQEQGARAVAGRTGSGTLPKPFADRKLRCGIGCVLVLAISAISTRRRIASPFRSTATRRRSRRPTGSRLRLSGMGWCCSPTPPLVAGWHHERRPSDDRATGLADDERHRLGRPSAGMRRLILAKWRQQPLWGLSIPPMYDPREHRPPRPLATLLWTASILPQEAKSGRRKGDFRCLRMRTLTKPFAGQGSLS